MFAAALILALGLLAIGAPAAAAGALVALAVRMLWPRRRDRR